MKALLAILLLTAAVPVFAQDFLGQWKLVRIFTTANLQKDQDNRMLLLVSQGQKTESKIDGVLLPKAMTVEFSINPNNKAQHVTLADDGLLLMSLNWKDQSAGSPGDPILDRDLRVWTDNEAVYDVYSLLYNDAKTLVFSDRPMNDSRFLDIYYLEKPDGVGGSTP
jgi:hypothetical protein